MMLAGGRSVEGNRSKSGKAKPAKGVKATAKVAAKTAAKPKPKSKPVSKARSKRG
jgi:hypothetical protein